MPTEFDYTLVLFSGLLEPKGKRPGRHLPEEKYQDFKEAVLKKINSRKREFSPHSLDADLFLTEKMKANIDRLVAEAPFTKNRKEKLRRFIMELARWDDYIKHMSWDLRRLYGCIYHDFMHYTMSFTPLPVNLMQRWVSEDVPARKDAGLFRKDILAKIKNPEAGELVERCYRPDTAGTVMLLRKDLPDEAVRMLRNILLGIGYRNRSSSKYIYFLKYLVERGVLEPAVNYSTNGRCKYYKVQFKNIRDP